MSDTYPVLRKWSYVEVAFWSVMVACGETYVSAFALAVGMSERSAGVLAILPLGVASIIQIFSSHVLEFFKNRKRFVVICAALQAISLLTLAIQPNFAGMGFAGLAFLIALYWIFGLAAGPTWNTWIVGMVPADRTFHFFAQRGRINNLFLVIGLLFSAVVLHILNGTQTSFTILFLLAGICRLGSAYALARHPGEPAHAVFPKPTGLFHFGKWFLQPKVAMLVALLGCFQFGVAAGAPFITPFLLKPLGYSYEGYIALICIPLLSRAISYPFNEKLVVRWGLKNMIVLYAFLVAITPFFWAHLPTLSWIIFIQIVGGWAWAGFEYGVLLHQIAHFGPHERTRVLTWTNLFVGLCNIGGVLLGSELLTKAPSSLNYETVFTVSGIIRMVPIVPFLLFRWEFRQLTVVPRMFFRLMSLAVGRGGAFSRPVVYLRKKKAIPLEAPIPPTKPST